MARFNARPVVRGALVFMTAGSIATAGLYAMVAFLWAMANPTGGSGDAMLLALPFVLFPLAVVTSLLPMLAAGATSYPLSRLRLPRILATFGVAAMAAVGGLFELSLKRAAVTGASEIVTFLQVACLTITAFVLHAFLGPKLDNNAVTG